MAVGLRSLPFGIAPAGSANQSQVVDLGFEFAAFFGSAGSSPRFAKRLYSQLAGYRANRLVACGAIAAGPTLTWSKDGTAVAGLEAADTDALIAAAAAEGFGAFAVPQPVGMGTNLSKAHSVGATDTWNFGTAGGKRSPRQYSTRRPAAGRARWS